MLMVKKLNLWWSLNNPIFCHCGGHKSRSGEENEFNLIWGDKYIGCFF